jgi:hypothetical protein
MGRETKINIAATLRAKLFRAGQSIIVAGMLCLGFALPAAASYLPFNTSVKMNVGIGSASPGVSLDVNGTVRMTGFNIANGAGLGKILTSDASGNGTWGNPGAGSNYWLLNGGAGNVGINTINAVGIGTSFVGGTGEAALSVMNGNVGIGTWVPGYALETEGGSVGLGVNSNTSFLQIGQLANSQSVPNGLSLKDYITSTASNQSEAEVEAIPRAASNTSSTYFGIVGDVNNNLASAVNYTASVGLAGVGGYTTSSGSGIITGVASIYAGNSSYTGSGGGITNAYGVFVSDQNAATNNYGVYSGISAGNNKWNFYGIGTAPNYFDGNVGIGSLIPGQALDITGTVRTTGFTLSGNGAANGNVLVGNSVGVGTWMPVSTLGAASGTNYWLLNGGSNVGINTTQAVGIGTSFVGGTGEASLSVINGNVGIGTWVPTNLLDVENGNIGIGTAFGITAGGNNLITMRNDTTSIYAGTQAGATVAGSSLYNVVMGYQALDGSNISTGNNNIALGYQALYRNNTANTNIAIGYEALQGNGSITGNDNIAIGDQALTLSNGVETDNIAIGGLALYTNTGVQNIAIGETAIKNNGAANSNTAVGFAALENANGGGTNTALGNLALANSSGSGSVAVGSQAGQVYPGGGLLTSNNSVFLGASTESQSSTDSNEIVIGYGAVGNGNNTVTLGNTGIVTTVLQGNVGIGTFTPVNQLVINGAVGIGTANSSYVKTVAPVGGMIVQGNVGIGSTAPGTTLDVNGTARVGGFTLTGNGAANGNVLVGNSVGVGTWMPVSTLGAAGGSNYWLLNGGSNVGINTTQAVGIGTSFVGGTGEAALSIMNGNVGIGTWVPYSGFQLNSSFAVYRTSTAASVSSAGQVIIGVTDTTAARTITLSTSDVAPGRIIIIKDESGGAATHNITINTQGGQTIDNVSSVTITANYGVVRVYSDGSKWFTF